MRRSVTIWFLLVVSVLMAGLIFVPSTGIGQMPVTEEDMQPVDEFKVATDYSVEIAAGGDDDWWRWTGTEWTTHNYVGVYIECHNASTLEYVGQFRFQLNIPKDATIESANFTGYEWQDMTVEQATVKRLNETNVGSLADDTEKPVWSNVSSSLYDWDGVDSEWRSANVTDLVQEQVNLGDWSSGYYIGLQFWNSYTLGWWHRWESYDNTTSHNVAYLNVTYTNGDGEEEEPATWLEDYTFRKQHLIEQTAGADINHTVPFEVYLGSGLDSENTTYLNSKAMAGLTDVRFTDENHSVLEYWLEEYYYSGTPTDYFTDTVSAFGIHDRIYPPAVYYNNRTYIAHHGEGMNPMITYYDHENVTWGPEIEIAQNLLGPIGDTHGPPAMWIDNSGYIHVLYGAHNEPIPHAVSTYPNRIDAWTSKPAIGTDYSYPTVAYDAVNDVVHLWARDVASPNMTLAYTNSTNGGDSWSTEQRIVNMIYGQCWPYKGTGGVDHVNPEIVHISWAHYNQSSGSSYYQNIRYVYLNATTGLVYNASGHSQGYEVTSQEHDDVLAWDSNGWHVYGPTMKVPSDSSEPYFVVQVLEAGGRYSTMVFWNSTSSSWEGEYNITTATTNWGGASDFVIYAKDNISAFLTNGTGDIGHWNWDGSSWSFVEWVYHSSMGRDTYMLFTYVPAGQSSWNNGHNETLRVIMTEYDSRLGEHIKMFAWGTEGLVQRTPITGAKFWIKVPVNLTETDFTLNIYYGEPDVWSVGEWFATSASPTVTHGTWNATEYLTVTNTTSGYDMTTFYETLQSDYMLFPDNETHGYYFAEDGADLSDWTYSDSAPTTDGDVMSLHVVGDSNSDDFVCNDTSMPAGYYYLEYYARANVTTTSYYWVKVCAEDGGQGAFTLIDDVYLLTTWQHRKMGIWIDHAIESIVIAAKATVSDTKFDIDWMRFTNETGWQHDGSSTYGVEAVGDGFSASSDGNYLSLINTGAGWGGFNFSIDPTATRTMLDPDMYPFLHIDFHPDDSDDWYYLQVYDDSGLHVVYQSFDNWAIDIYYNVKQAGPSEINYLYIKFSGARTIRIDSMKLYFIANFTLQKNIVSPFGALHVEDGALVSNNSLNNWMILEYDINPTMDLDNDVYNSIEVNRSAGDHSLYFAFYTGSWGDYNRSQFITGASANITNFRLKISNAGTLYSVTFGNRTTGGGGAGGGTAPTNDQTPTCANADDTDNLYAEIQEYQITANVSDADGFADLDYLEISLYSNDRVTLYWTVRFDEDTATFSEQSDSSNMVRLNTTASTNSTSGNTLNVTFYIEIHWNHTDLADTDIKQYVTDDHPATDTDWYETNFDIETRLDVLDLAVTPSSGDANPTNLVISGKVIYYQSASNVSPTSALVDVWVTWVDQSWSDLTLSSGDFSITGVSCGDASATFTAKVVTEGGGSSGSDLSHTTHTTTYTVTTSDDDDSGSDGPGGYGRETPPVVPRLVVNVWALIVVGIAIVFAVIIFFRINHPWIRIGAVIVILVCLAVIL